MMNIKRILILICISTILMLLLIPLGGYPFGHHIKFSISLVSYFVLTYLCIRKISEIKQQLLVTFFIMLPLFLLYGIFFTYLFGFIFYQLSVPSNLSGFLGIISALLFVNANKLCKIVLLTSMILGSVWMTFFGFDLWLNKINFGTISGLIKQNINRSFSFYNQDGSKLNTDSFGDKIIILDFWTSSCGICFQKFPALSKKYFEFKNDSTIKIFSVNIPIPRDSINTPFNIVKNKGYDFPVVVDRDSLGIKYFKINAVPTVIVIRNRTIYFRGDINSIDNCILNIKKNL